MTKTYYKNEYSDKQWKALIDKALEMGCKITYDIYGTRAVIDSTELEDKLIRGKEENRMAWAEHIHKVLQDSTNLRRWIIAPTKHHESHCPVIYRDKRTAEHEKERIERITGFKWMMREMSE